MRYQSQNRWAGFAIVDRRWADYPVSDRSKVVAPAPLMVVTFADGEVVRASFATLEGEALNVGRGLQNAIAFYRARIARRCHSDPCDDGRGFCIDVPAIAACSVKQKGADNLALFPHTVTVATAKLRRGTFDLARVKEEARDRRLPLLATGDALDEAKLIERRYQRAAARHLLAHPQLMEKYRGVRAVEDIRHIATSKDLTLNKPTTPPGRARNQFMSRPKKTWHKKTWRIAA